jgi:hypothetical protein
VETDLAAVVAAAADYLEQDLLRNSVHQTAATVAVAVAVGLVTPMAALVETVSRQFVFISED